MARQFRLVNIRPSANGKTYTAEVVDRDWTRFTTPPEDVRVMWESTEGNPIIKFPARKLVGNNILDFDR